jgi:hypothetical protein
MATPTPVGFPVSKGVMAVDYSKVSAREADSPEMISWAFSSD